MPRWIGELQAAGLRIERVEEPIDPDTRRLLSLLMTCREDRS